MSKKMYQKPDVKTMHLVEEANVLAASGDAPTIEINGEEEITDGVVDSKGHSKYGVWDD